MNRLKQAALFLFISLAAISCNNTEEDASSTPIDSTNVNGTAPATYGTDNPANPDYPVNEGSFDTTLPANTTNAADSL